MLWTYSQEIHIHDIYDCSLSRVKSILKIERKISVAFRPPKIGETFLSIALTGSIVAEENHSDRSPRLILVPSPQPDFDLEAEWNA